MTHHVFETPDYELMNTMPAFGMSGSLLKNRKGLSPFGALVDYNFEVDRYSNVVNWFPSGCGSNELLTAKYQTSDFRTAWSLGD